MTSPSLKGLLQIMRSLWSISKGRNSIFTALVSMVVLVLASPFSTFAFQQFEIFPKGKSDSDPRKFRLGRIQLHPGLSLESKYDSNVFLLANKGFANGTSEGRLGDFIVTTKPSLGMELARKPGEFFGFTLDYLGEYEHFNNLTGTQNTFNHNFEGNLNFGGAGGKSDITIGGSYDKSRNVRTFDFQTNIGNRLNIEIYTGLFDFIYFPTKDLRLQVGTDFTEWRFDEPNQTFDSVLYKNYGSIFLRKTPLLTFGLLYEHYRRDYKSPAGTGLDDSHTDQVFLGARWQTTPWIESELFIGINSKKFDNLSSEDSQNLVYIIELKYQPTERTTLTLKGSREIMDTAFRTSQFIIYNGARMEFAQKLGKKFKAKLMGRYENFDYRNPLPDLQELRTKTRIDNRVEGSLALIYEIEDWLDAKAKYSYIENISNFNANDFIDHVGLLEISSHF